MGGGGCIFNLSQLLLKDKSIKYLNIYVKYRGTITQVLSSYYLLCLDVGLNKGVTQLQSLDWIR